MQTALPAEFRATAQGREAEAVLRACVHCGFCNATCPTYQLLGDELDGPRGRIYLIKQLLETGRAEPAARVHLDRCLTCRNCETTCPSGVRYARLLDIARERLQDDAAGQPVWQRVQKRLLRAVLPHRRRFAALLAAGRAVRPLLPRALRAQVPPRRPQMPWPRQRDGQVHARRMLLHEGCVQPALAPEINAAAAVLLDRKSIAAQPAAGCCGALSFHLGAVEEARRHARRNLARWWPQLEQGAEAVVSTASGCGVFIKDYAHLLPDDPRAAQLARCTKDLSELFAPGELRRAPGLPSLPIAVHAPCTLTHGQRLDHRIEHLLAAAGYALAPVSDAHLCCGSAGTYSMLQPELSRRLRDNKIASLTADRPAAIATANIGCLHHLAGGTEIPVRHWAELLV